MKASPALLAALAWFAVLLQLWLSIQLGYSNGKTLFDGLVAYFGYFTVLTNIFVALVCTIGAMARGSMAATTNRSRLYGPMIVGCATTAIVLVGIVYHLLLRKIWSPQGAQWLADVLLHYAVPLGAVVHWLTYARGADDVATERLPAWAPLAWCVYPLAYVVYVIARGEWLGSYPYPFIDVSALGYPQALINTVGLLAAFIGLGYLVRLAARFAHHAR
jgi:hypothetical protein